MQLSNEALLDCQQWVETEAVHINYAEETDGESALGEHSPLNTIYMFP